MQMTTQFLIDLKIQTKSWNFFERLETFQEKFCFGFPNIMAAANEGKKLKRYVTRTSIKLTRSFSVSSYKTSTQQSELYSSSMVAQDSSKAKKSLTTYRGSIESSLSNSFTGHVSDLNTICELDDDEQKSSNNSSKNKSHNSINNNNKINLNNDYSVVVNIGNSMYNSNINNKSKSKSISPKNNNRPSNINALNIDNSVPGNNKMKYNMKQMLKDRGYTVTNILSKKKIGVVYLCKEIKTNLKYIIKIRKRSIYKNGGTVCLIKQDIIKEKRIIKFLESYDPPNGFIKCYDYFIDKEYIFMVLQNGGVSLFEYIKNSHELIKGGNIDVSEWKKHIKVLVSQILLYINWLHNWVFCIHFDISLENMVINGVKYDIATKKFISHGQISFIDFSVADILSPKHGFKTKRLVGKTNYMSPEMYAEKMFNAKSNGIIIY